MVIIIIMLVIMVITGRADPAGQVGSGGATGADGGEGGEERGTDLTFQNMRKQKISMKIYINTIFYFVFLYYLIYILH